MKERFDRLEEQLEILTGLWNTPSGEAFSFTGRHWQIANNVSFPGSGTHRS